jgi:hypothetical protein
LRSSAPMRKRRPRLVRKNPSDEGALGVENLPRSCYSQKLRKTRSGSHTHGVVAHENVHAFFQGESHGRLRSAFGPRNNPHFSGMTTLTSCARPCHYDCTQASTVSGTRMSARKASSPNGNRKDHRAIVDAERVHTHDCRHALK